MQFELDEILTNEIIFYMENQDGEFVFDSNIRKIINTKVNKEINLRDEARFFPLPEWKSNDGYRLMEKFCADLKNPAARTELADALGRSKGVFRSFKNTLEQYPGIEKLWFRFKSKKMKELVINWYNSLREEWGLEPVGNEPDDNFSLILEDFILREGNAGDYENAAALHNACTEERKNQTYCGLTEETNPFVFPGDLCITTESANGDFCGYLSAVRDSASLRICHLEVQREYRGIGVGKTLLAKFMEKAESLNFKLNVTIDLPNDLHFFSRSLHLENFKPYAQRFVFTREQS